MPPPLTTHPKKVQVLIRRLKTPLQVQQWINSLDYNKENTMHTLDQVVRRGRAHCLEGVLSAAAILEYHGYPPLILDLESTDLLDHTLFLYKHKGKYGAVGQSRDIGLDGRMPVYPTILSLVKSYAAPYIDEKACLKKYGLLDLSGAAGPGSAGRTLARQTWRTSKKSVWYVEEALRNIPHKKLALSPAYVKFWRQRFIEFKKKNLGKQPDYFPQQENWM